MFKETVAGTSGIPAPSDRQLRRPCKYQRKIPHARTFCCHHHHLCFMIGVPRLLWSGSALPPQTHSMRRGSLSDSRSEVHCRAQSGFSRNTACQLLRGAAKWRNLRLKVAWNACSSLWRKRGATLLRGVSATCRRRQRREACPDGSATAGAPLQERSAADGVARVESACWAPT